MKNTVKVLAIIALAAVFGLAFPACNPEPEGDGTSPHTHAYGTTWKSNATQHWHECSCGEKADIAAHTASDWIVDLAATTTTAGSQHKECTVCGYVTETEAIPIIHSHTWSTAWTSDATQHWHECTANDGAKTDVAAHEWGNYIETTAPTITADGIETRTCATCGKTETRTGSAALATPFFGTWNTTSDGGVIITINVSSLTQKMGSSTIVLENLVWEVAVNDTVTTKNEYPSGYKITGKVSVKSSDPIIVGEEISTTLFINNNNNKFWIKSDNDNNIFTKDDSQPCTTCLTTYGTTAHLGIDANGNVVACTCGGTNCSNCTEQTNTWNDIPFRKNANVSVKQMNDTVATIKGIMDDEGYQDKDMFEAKGLTAIHIVSGDEVNFQNGILTVGCDAEFTDILFKFDDIYNGIAQIQQHPPQTITFGTDLSTTVTGPAMTGTQWNAVIANLTAALNAAANDGDVGFYCTALFTTMGATINLVKTQEYNYYSLDLTNITASKISLNTDYVIGASQADLSEKVLAVVNAVAGQAPIQAKAPAHDNGLERLNRRIS